MEWIDEHQIPIVAFAGPGPYMVGINSHEIIRLGVKALAEKGCQRIAYWSPVAPYRPVPQHLPQQLPLNPKKLEVFARSLSASSLPLYPEFIEQNEDLAILPTFHTQSHQEQGYNLVMKIFGPESDPRTRPDGILSSDDMQTQGALTALQRLGIRVGEEIQIATHANVGSPALLGWENDITLIEVDPSEIVHQMLSRLERLMEGITPDQKIYEVTPRLRGT